MSKCYKFRSYKGESLRDSRLNSRQVGVPAKWNDKESRVKMSQVERKRVGVKLERRRLKELLNEEDLTATMTIEEENSLRADLHIDKRLTPEEEREQDMAAIAAWNAQYCEDEANFFNEMDDAEYLRYLERLDLTILSRGGGLDDDIDQRELVSMFD